MGIGSPSLAADGGGLGWGPVAEKRRVSEPAMQPEE